MKSLLPEFKHILKSLLFGKCIKETSGNSVSRAVINGVKAAGGVDGSGKQLRQHVNAWLPISICSIGTRTDQELSLLQPHMASTYILALFTLVSSFLLWNLPFLLFCIPLLPAHLMSIPLLPVSYPFQPCSQRWQFWHWAVSPSTKFVLLCCWKCLNLSSRWIRHFQLTVLSWADNLALLCLSLWSYVPHLSIFAWASFLTHM